MLWIIITLLLNLLIETSVSFTVVVPRDQIVAHVGSTVTLPCWISPPENAEALEIRWYRHDQFSNPVLFYQHGKIQDLQEESYRNRTSLTQWSDQSGGLKDGDVSLRLEKLTVQDEGSFHCYVSGESAYDSGEVVLKITVPKTSVTSTSFLRLRELRKAIDEECRATHNIQPNSTLPMIPPSVLPPVPPTENYQFSHAANKRLLKTRKLMTCDSGTLLYARLSVCDVMYCCLPKIGLCLHMLMMKVFPIMSTPRCSVELPLRKGTLFDIKPDPPDSSDPWKALFFTLLICALLGLVGLILYKYRHKLTGKKPEDKNEGEINIEELRKHAAQITIHQHYVSADLIVSKDRNMVWTNKEYKHTGKGFPYKLCAFGAQKFTSRRHYWEVSLARPPNPPKNYWLIGVAKDESFRSKDKSVTPSNGFWFLCSDGPNGFYTSSDPPVKLSLTPRPERLGVLFDYDDGQLSFYNVKEKKHLLTMSTRFTGSVVPLFNPGAGDLSPLKILDCPKPVESPEESSQLLMNNSESTSDTSGEKRVKSK
ncbi:butyrophilin-like protein 8 [Chanodichthys erythropterus]|uniref:butyrophilin-like protein 8 n=1 Tax=Chanodichthys erythropterus TaxID=933992 RepID=UPI00351E8CAD